MHETDMDLLIYLFTYLSKKLSYMN